MIAIMLGMTVTMNDALYQSAQQATAKGNIAVAAETMTQDLRMAGRNVAGNAFSTADTTNMWFSGALDSTGSVSTIHYNARYDSTTHLYKLYRSVSLENGGRDFLVGSNLTNVRFLYYDLNGVLTSTPANVVSVRVKLEMQILGTTQAYTSAGFTSTISDFKVYPINL
jgi:hypothetical protein